MNSSFLLNAIVEENPIVANSAAVSKYINVFIGILTDFKSYANKKQQK